MSDTTNLTDSVRALAERHVDEILERREEYVTAWIAETGLRPTDCELVLRNDLLEPTARVRARVGVDSTEPVERVACGEFWPDPDLNETLWELLHDRGTPPFDKGCGGRGVWVYMYRCVECGRFFHRDCILKHFAAHGAEATK